MRKFKTIVVLAGGVSKRFWPLGPKNLLPFLDTPLLQHRIEALLPWAEEIFIVANEGNKDEVEKCIPQSSQVHVILQKEHGFAHSFKAISERVSGEVVVINGVDIFDIDSHLTHLQAATGGHDLLLSVREMEEYFPGGYLRIHEGRPVEVVEKPAPEARPSNLVCIVCNWFKSYGDFSSFLDKHDSLGKDGAFEQVLNAYMQERSVGYVACEGEFSSLKFPWDTLTVMQHFLKTVTSYRGSDVTVGQGAIIEGEVFLGDGVKVMEYAKIVGPTYIGAGTIVANYAMVLESMIGAQSLIGGYSEVTRSYLGEGVYLHRNYVGDSVLEKRILLGAESVIANWRFDTSGIKSPVDGEMVNSGREKLGAMVGSDVKIGVNSSIMPGVKIEGGTSIMPHSLVTKDVRT